MKKEKQDEIIEEWMLDAYSEYSTVYTVYDLELAEGLKHVARLRTLLDVCEAKLNKQNTNNENIKQVKI